MKANSIEHKNTSVQGCEFAAKSDSGPGGCAPWGDHAKFSNSQKVAALQFVLHGINLKQQQ